MYYLITTNNWLKNIFIIIINVGPYNKKNSSNIGLVNYFYWLFLHLEHETLKIITGKNYNLEIKISTQWVWLASLEAFN